MTTANLTDYESQISNLANQLQQATSIKDEKYDVKAKANEIVRTLGEAKTFISGQKVSKYLVGKGKEYLQDAVDKAGVKLSEVSRAGSAGLRDAGGQVADNVVNTGAGLTADEAGVVTGTRLATDTYGNIQQFAETPLSTLSRGTANVSGVSNPYGDIAESDAGWPTRPAAEQYLDIDDEATQANRLAANPTYDQVGSSGLQEPIYDNAMDGGEAGEDAGAATQTYLDVAPKAGNNALGAYDNALDDVTGVEASDKAVDKSAAEAGEGLASKGAGEEGGAVAGEEAGEETAVAATEGIPIVDIVGTAIGIGLTVESLVKKPKFKPPADNINTSYQVGI